MNTRTPESALQEQLNTLIPLNGFMYAFIIDSRIDFLLAHVAPQDGMDVKHLATQAGAIVKSDIEANIALGVSDATESIIFTSENEVRIIHKLHSIDNYVFIMLGLRKDMANVALALHQLRAMEPKLKL